MKEIQIGDTVVLTAKVPEGVIYPFAIEGAEAVVNAIHPGKDYPYQLIFPGDHVVDPRGCVTIVRDPALLFNRDEIELKEG